MKYTPLKKYYFIAEDDFGCYNEDGSERKGSYNQDGYKIHFFKCTDGKYHSMLEHRLKWEYFNGEIPKNMEIDHIIPIKDGGTNKLSNLRLVNHQENMNNPLTLVRFSNRTPWNIGKKHSEDTITKMTNAKIGKHHSEETKRKIRENSHKKMIYQYTLEGELVQTFNSTKELPHNYFSSAVSACCHGKLKKYKGFIWSHKPLNKPS